VQDQARANSLFVSGGLQGLNPLIPVSV